MHYLLFGVFFVIHHFLLLCSLLILGIFSLVLQGRLEHLGVVHQCILSKCWVGKMLLFQIWCVVVVW